MLHELWQIFRGNKSIRVSVAKLIISKPTLILWMFLWTTLKTQIWRYTMVLCLVSAFAIRLLQSFLSTLLSLYFCDLFLAGTSD
ncbi:unnamed protein product [Brassica oleracea]